MNKDHVKGTFNETKGKIKEEVGHAVGNDSTAAEGVFDQVKGKVQKAVGDLKDVVKEKVDHLLEKDTDLKKRI